METLNQTLAKVIRRHPEVKLAYLFGSRATECAGPLSDLDLAVYLEVSDSLTRHDLRMTLHDEVSRALGTDRVDVTVLDPAGPPEFNYQVIRDGVILHEEEPYRVILEPRILNAYFDFRDSLRRHRLTAA
jgi:predicted nucleotidyltransferase